jgi:hypothetical protein
MAKSDPNFTTACTCQLHGDSTGSTSWDGPEPAGPNVRLSGSVEQIAKVLDRDLPPNIVYSQRRPELRVT